MAASSCLRWDKVAPRSRGGSRPIGDTASGRRRLTQTGDHGLKTRRTFESQEIICMTGGAGEGAGEMDDSAMAFRPGKRWRQEPCARLVRTQRPIAASGTRVHTHRYLAPVGGARRTFEGNSPRERYKLVLEQDKFAESREFAHPCHPHPWPTPAPILPYLIALLSISQPT